MEPSQAKHLSSSGAGRSSANLASYDGARFSIFLGDVGEGMPLHGRARFQRDDALGNILRISFEGIGPGSPAVIISEADWDGVIARDFRHDADYRLILRFDWQADKNRSPDGEDDLSRRS